MRSILLPGVLLAGLGLLAGCGSTEDAAPPVTLELATWWNQGSESSALDALLAVHREAHPEVTINTVKLSDQQTLQTTMTNRLTAGNPPAGFQANLGGSALAWGTYSESLSASSTSWASAFDKVVLDQLTYNGQLIGVPLALTRQNAAYWNLKVLNTLTTLTNKIPENQAQFDTWLTEVAAAGYTHPLCFSGKDAWVSAHIVFEDIVPAVAGAAFSKEYWSGAKMGDAPEMVAALEYAKTIAGYISTDWVEMDMTAGINKLMSAETDPSAQCLMTPMGDWGGAILSDKNTPDMDFTGTGWPGKDGNKSVVFGGDTFVAAKGAANQAAVFDFFATMASEKGQIEFNFVKGSMPARGVSDASRFKPLTQKNMSDYAAGSTAGSNLAGYKLIGKSAYKFDDLATKVQEFLISKSATDLTTFLKDNYSSLR